MTDFTRDIIEHEALADRIERALERVSSRHHRITLQSQLAAVNEDLKVMRQAQWLSRDDARGPWIELKC